MSVFYVKSVSMRKLFVLLLSIFICQNAFAQCISGDCENGWGTYIFPGDNRYVGEFKNGIVHGAGVCYYDDGRQYSGQWAYRYPHGNGVMTTREGKIFQGTWEKGLFSGERAQGDPVFLDFLSPNGELPVMGCVSGDCENGYGLFISADGNKYQGAFDNGEPQGLGVLFKENGERYVGQFKQKLPHGMGTYYKKDQSKLAGYWQEGRFVRPAFQSGSIREGCLTGNCRNGWGLYVFKNAEAAYTGEFQDNRPNGSGVCLYANGDRFEGEWSDGSFHGKGTLFLKNNDEVKGYWEDGNYVGWFSNLTYTQEKSAASHPIQDNEEVKSPRVWAVVVGVSSYKHMPALRFTDDDAYRIFAFLKSPEGGAVPDEQMRILIDEDATRQKILETVADVFKQASEDDLVIMYFSGHGLKGAFLPIDYDGVDNKIFHEELSDIIDGSKAKFKLIIADACHSGSLLASKGLTDDHYFIDFYESLVSAEPGIALIMSSKSDETSLESSGLRQGVFTHFLIRGWKGEADSNNDKRVTLAELYNFIFQGVRQYTGERQSPIIKGRYNKNMILSLVREEEGE